MWPESLLNRSRPVCKKPTVKTSQTLRNCHGPTSRRGIAHGLVLEAKLHLFIYVTYCSYHCNLTCRTRSSREVSQIMLDMPEARLAMGICCRHHSLRERSVSILFSKEPKQCDANTLWCISPFMGYWRCCACKCCLSTKLRGSDGMQHTMPIPVSSLRAGIRGEQGTARFLSHMHPLFHGWWPELFCFSGNNNFYNHWVFIHRGCPEASPFQNSRAPGCHYLTALWNRSPLLLETDPTALHKWQGRNSNLGKIWALEQTHTKKQVIHILPFTVI